MLKAKQIICMGFPKWKGDYMKSTVLLMTQLAKNNNLLYVDYPFTWKDVVGGSLSPDKVPALSILGLQARLRKLTLSNQAQLHLLSLPPFIPSNWASSPGLHDQLLAYNGRKAALRIKKAMKQLHFSNPIVVNAFNPALGNVLAGKLEEELLVYYCYDEISAAPWVSKHGSRHEDRFLKTADLTIVSSEQLRKDKSLLSSNCRLVKNGVSLDLFQGVERKTTDHQNVTIGYLGSVDDRLDFQLLAKLIEQLPDYQFQFVGRIVDKKGASRLAKYPNCQLLGARPPAELAKFVADFQLGLIPFKCNKLTAGIYPLKINEYLAMGIPVTATRFTDLSEFENLVYSANGVTAFKQAIQLAIAEDTPDKILARKRYAGSNSWERRAADFGQAIYQSLERKAKQPAFR